jgi:hypothetical protein
MESNQNQFVYKINKPILSRGTLKEITLTSTQKEIHIILGELISFNSLGIREWILWLAPLKTRNDLKIFLHECSPITMRQINMLTDFLPANAEVCSFYVPYISDTSGESKAVLFTKGKEYDQKKVDLPKVFDSQGGLMELDVIEKTYFQFLYRK